MRDCIRFDLHRRGIEDDAGEADALAVAGNGGNRDDRAVME